MKKFPRGSKIRAIQDNYPYDPNEPSKTKNVYYLRVIKPLKWHKMDTIANDIPLGSITWSYGYRDGESVLLENNRYFTNYDPSCFELIYCVKHESSLDKNNDSGFIWYRFKSEKEFKDSGRWDYRGVGHPIGWNTKGDMNHYLSKKLIYEENKILNDEAASTVVIRGRMFCNSDFIPESVPLEDNTTSNISYPTKQEVIEKYEEKQVEYVKPISSRINSVEEIKKQENDEIFIESTINITI